jgi:hypothetical protein
LIRASQAAGSSAKKKKICKRLSLAPTTSKYQCKENPIAVIDHSPKGALFMVDKKNQLHMIV